MPALAPETTTPTERRKPPRRSWRQLPASPPVADPLPTPNPDQLIAGALAADAVGDGDGDGLDPDAVAAAPARRRRRGLVVAGAIGAVVLAGAATFATLRDDSTPSSARSSATTTPGSPSPTLGSGGTGSNGSNGGGGNGSVQDIVKKVSPAVVQLEPNGGVGSGVLFDKSGLILTAHHVVAGVEELNVKLADGTEVAGRVVGRLPERDLAVVAVDAGKDLPAAELAGEDTVEVGEAVVAIGSPFGISQTVTSGIVSGLDREIESPVGTLTGLIQTDAPINPGNSGGPLIDADAKVIGINSAIASTSGTSSGVGFAVPVADAKDMIDQVRQAGGNKAPSVPDDSSSSVNPNDPFGGLLPPGFGGGDPSEMLQRLLDELLRGGLGGLDPSIPGGSDNQGGNGSGSGTPAQPSLGLISLGDLPSGYTQQRSSARTSSNGGNDEGTHEILVRGPKGNVAIVATRGASAKDTYEKLDGVETNVAGTTGKAIEGGVAWMAGDDLLVVINADDGVPNDDVLSVADAVQVR